MEKLQCPYYQREGDCCVHTGNLDYEQRGLEHKRNIRRKKCCEDFCPFNHTLLKDILESISQKKN